MENTIINNSVIPMGKTAFGYDHIWSEPGADSGVFLVGWVWGSAEAIMYTCY